MLHLLLSNIGKKSIFSIFMLFWFQHSFQFHFRLVHCIRFVHIVLQFFIPHFPSFLCPANNYIPPTNTITQNSNSRNVFLELSCAMYNFMEEHLAISLAMYSLRMGLLLLLILHPHYVWSAVRHTAGIGHFHA